MRGKPRPARNPLMPPLPEADLDHILAHTRDLWELMRGQNLFITGGTGFFGRWMLESFVHINAKLELNTHAVVLTRRPKAFAERAPELAAQPCLAFVEGDVSRLNHGSLLNHLPPGHGDIFRFVIHAAMDSVGQEYPLAAFETIVTGTRQALEFATQAGATRFLFTSSGAVYGKQPPDLTHIPESYAGAPDCTQPASAYGEAKRAAELLCCLPHSSLEAVIARCFAFVGPHLPLDAHFAIGNFIRDALRGGPIKIGGDGTPHRSYLYAADLAIWLWTLLFRGQPARAYNVGSEQDVTILELAQTVAGCFPTKPDVDLARQPVPGVPPSRYVPATGRAAAELGLRVLIPLKEAISRTAAWHSPNP